MLLEAKADVNFQNEMGLTPLHEVIRGLSNGVEQHTRIDIIKALIAAKAEVNPVTVASPPLHYALDRGYFPGCGLTVGVDGWYPEAAQHLIEACADPNALGEEEREDGATAGMGRL